MRRTEARIWWVAAPCAVRLPPPLSSDLWTDAIDQVIEALRFLVPRQRAAVKRTAVGDLARYLTTNRDRMRSRTFRAAGYALGGGAVESAVSHVVQQRMKRVGIAPAPGIASGPTAHGAA